MNITLLNAKAATGTGSAVHALAYGPPDTGADTSKQTVKVVITGSPTAVTVGVNIGLDNTDFGRLATHTFTSGELTAKFAIFSIDKNTSSEWFQGEVDTLTAGTSPTVSMYLYWGSI